jgi:hypothetical protein
MEAVKAMIFNVTERPPVREGSAWPMRPLSFGGGQARIPQLLYLSYHGDGARLSHV